MSKLDALYEPIIIPFISSREDLKAALAVSVNKKAAFGPVPVTTLTRPYNRRAGTFGTTVMVLLKELHEEKQAYLFEYENAHYVVSNECLSFVYEKLHRDIAELLPDADENLIMFKVKEKLLAQLGVLIESNKS